MADEITQSAGNAIAAMNATAATIGSSKDMKRQWDYNKKAMDYANEINKQNFEAMKGAEYDKMLYGKTFEKQGLMQAGLNPAWHDGEMGVAPLSADIAPSTAMASSISPSKQGIDAFLQTAQTIAQSRLMDAQAQKTTEEAKSVKLANEEVEDERDVLTGTQFLMYGHKAYTDDDGVWWVKYGIPGEDDEAVIRMDQLPKTKKGYDALNTFRQYERNKYVSQTEEDKTLLEDMVTKMQINDKDVQEALANMPTELIRELRAKNSAQEMENEIVNASKSVWRQLENKPDVIKFLASAFYTFLLKK